MTRVILFFLFSVVVFYCSAQQFTPETKGKRAQRASTYHLKEIPPGVVKLANGLMMDETEITNFNWMEYMFWIERKFGKHSQVYIDALPDTNVWKDVESCLYAYTPYYLRHPAYRDYPVVGVSQDQALKFCEWRSNRVMEYILIRDGVLEWDPWQTAEEHFTIEQYFKGNYRGCIPDTNYKFVPLYNLPSIKEWKYAVKHTDSLEWEFLGRSKKRDDRICWSNPFINTDFAGCSARTIDVTAPVISFCSKKRIKNYVYNLRGNVREWVIEKDTCIGGGWNDSKKMIYSQPAIQQTKKSSNTGFRCVCVWEKVISK
jgi:formylglycine-generating enzyme required for sulfatase activity